MGARDLISDPYACKASILSHGAPFQLPFFFGGGLIVSLIMFSFLSSQRRCFFDSSLASLLYSCVLSHLPPQLEQQPLTKPALFPNADHLSLDLTVLPLTDINRVLTEKYLEHKVILIDHLGSSWGWKRTMLIMSRQTCVVHNQTFKTSK